MTIRPFTPLLSSTKHGTALLIAGFLLSAACSRTRSPAAAALPPAISVETAAASERPMPRVLSVTGSLVANQRSEVAANAAGRVVKTLVERGSFVRRGGPLVQLDTRAAALGENEARANLRNAETQVALAHSTCARTETLLRQGAISKEEAERNSSQCETSLGSAEAAKARAELASKTRSDGTVRAPFSGMISDRYVSAGEYVQPVTKVAVLVELDPLRLQFTVGEADIRLVHVGQDISFDVEAFPGERFSGTVKYIDPTVRTATRDLVVEAAVPNHDQRLRPGMFAVARLPLPDQPVVSVPVAAIRRESTGGRLFAVVDGLIEERIVQLGTEKGGYLAVLDGVRPGERVVVSPSEGVRDGVPVK